MCAWIELALIALISSNAVADNKYYRTRCKYFANTIDPIAVKREYRLWTANSDFGVIDTASLRRNLEKNFLGELTTHDVANGRTPKRSLCYFSYFTSSG